MRTRLQNKCQSGNQAQLVIQGVGPYPFLSEEMKRRLPVLLSATPDPYALQEDAIAKYFVMVSSPLTYNHPISSHGTDLRELTREIDATEMETDLRKFTRNVDPTEMEMVPRKLPRKVDQTEMDVD